MSAAASPIPLIPTITPTLTPIQTQVILLLSTGSSLTAAAQAANIHRNTITHWRRTLPSFQAALTAAQYDRLLHFRDLTEENATLAISTLHHLLTDPTSSPSIRLRTALAVLKTTTTLPPPPPPATEALITLPDLPQLATGSSAPPKKPEIVHNSHNSAQPTASKTGRNAPCPCGSTRKYKQCCLNLPRPAALGPLVAP